MPFDQMNFELKYGALKLVRDVLSVKPGENVVIFGDTNSDSRVLDATAEAAYSLGGVPLVCRYETRPRPGIEPPRPLAAALAAADAVLEFAVSYVLYTKAFWDAMNNGRVRYLVLSGLDTDMLVRCVSRVDYVKMMQFGNRLVDLTKNATKFRATSPAGTDLSCEIDKEMVRHSGRILKEHGWATLGGQAGLGTPKWGTTNGTLVFDGCIWPPDEVNILREPVKLTIERNQIVKIEGGIQAEMFERWLQSLNDPNMYNLVHISYGFNPGVTRISGRILEDERVFGSFEVGIGSYQGRPAKAHTDGVVLNPSIWLDGKQIEKEGQYVDSELLDLSHKLTETRSSTSPST